MKTYQFKSNINCGNCVSKVSLKLDNNPEIHAWNVDTNNPDKILTVETETLDEDDIIDLVMSTGFEAEAI